ncbi:MAG: hypothetical protein HOE11_01990 [Candidatus Diapherotrites archaeon]|jgi:hypothetical protein|nr:hypothetical protein [Candidatus Diapherotrites archaeon]MBT4596684.1 hypothetical protein [Candidatus Diapherotrites archaeon]
MSKTRKPFVPEKLPSKVVAERASISRRRDEANQVRDVVKQVRRNRVSDTRFLMHDVPAELHEPIRLTAEKLRGTSHPFVRTTRKVAGVTVKGGMILVASSAILQSKALVREYKKYKKTLGDKLNPKIFFEKLVTGKTIAIVIPESMAPKELPRFVSSASDRAVVSTMVEVGVTLAVINAFLKRKRVKRLARRAIKEVNRLE